MHYCTWKYCKYFTLNAANTQVIQEVLSAVGKLICYNIFFTNLCLKFSLINRRMFYTDIFGTVCITFSGFTWLKKVLKLLIIFFQFLSILPISISKNGLEKLTFSLFFPGSPYCKIFQKIVVVWQCWYQKKSLIY